ncbi:hypothetical protein, partial [Bartonella bovis]|uniref:hypothetical protein n=1 Tax=Bartonella bovis TaxID=155194 RepID=UPI001304F112
GGATGTGVVMEGTEMMTMTDVRISKVEKAVLMKEGTVTMTGVQISGVKMGVEATNGTLTIKNGTIGFNDGANNYGVRVGR